jgi:hypothetical protein
VELTQATSGQDVMVKSRVEIAEVDRVFGGLLKAQS